MWAEIAFWRTVDGALQLVGVWLVAREIHKVRRQFTPKRVAA